MMKPIQVLFSALFALLLCTKVQAQVPETGPGRWEETIRNFEEKDRIDPPKEGVILFTGSSSVVMYKELEKHFPDYLILNRGFGGSEFSDLLHYADRVIYPYKPSKVFIYEGDNDVAAGEKPKEIIREARKLRREIAKALPAVPVVFISAKPSVARWHLKEQYEEVNKGLKKIADKTAHTLYADVWTAMLDEEGKVYEHIFLEDNLHMNPEGYEIWRKVLEPYLASSEEN